MIEEKSMGEADRMRQTINMILQNTETPKGETPAATMVFQTFVERVESLAGMGMDSITAAKVAYDEALAHAYLWRAAAIAGCDALVAIAHFEMDETTGRQAMNQTVLLPVRNPDDIEQVCRYAIASAKGLITHVAAASGNTAQDIYDVLGRGGFEDDPDLTIIHRHRTKPEGQDE